MEPKHRHFQKECVFEALQPSLFGLVVSLVSAPRVVGDHLSTYLKRGWWRHSHPGFPTVDVIIHSGHCGSRTMWFVSQEKTLELQHVCRCGLKPTVTLQWQHSILRRQSSKYQYIPFPTLLSFRNVGGAPGAHPGPPPIFFSNTIFDYTISNVCCP